MFKVLVRYPSFSEEFEVARRTTTAVPEEIEAVLSGDDILSLQKLVRRVPVTDHVIRYTLALVRQTRVGEEGVPDFITQSLAWGAGPRSVQFLILGGKVRALLHGRTHVSCEDIAALAAPVLRHRIVTNFAADSEGITPERIIERLLAETPSREDELTRDRRFAAVLGS